LLWAIVGLISAVSSASFSSAMSFFVTERVTRTVVTLEDTTELSLVDPLVTVVVVVEDSSTLFSGIRPRLGERRLGVTAVCCVIFSTRLSSDVFGAGRRPRLLAGDRDRERDLRAGERDLLRDGDRVGEVERDRNGSSFCKTKWAETSGKNFDKNKVQSCASFKFKII